MYLIVDSGSTKTDWFAVDPQGKVLFSTQTLGLNPQVLSSAILNERIINNYEIYSNRDVVTHLYFYGAGCGIASTVGRIRPRVAASDERVWWQLQEEQRQRRRRRRRRHE